MPRGIDVFLSTVSKILAAFWCLSHLVLIVFPLIVLTYTVMSMYSVGFLSVHRGDLAIQFIVGYFMASAKMWSMNSYFLED